MNINCIFVSINWVLILEPKTIVTKSIIADFRKKINPHSMQHNYQAIKKEPSFEGSLNL
jgi:hypothetical protein